MGGVHLGPKIATNREWVAVAAHPLTNTPPQADHVNIYVKHSITVSSRPFAGACIKHTLTLARTQRGVFIFFFLLTWLAHSGSAENSQLHLRAFSHDSSSAASEDQQSAQRALRSAICPGKAASRGKQWVLSLLWCRGTFQPLKYPTAFYYYYCPLSRMIHQTICESCACFPAGLSTFAIYFGQTGFQHFFFAFWEIALAFFHFVFSKQIFRKHSPQLLFRRLRPFSLSAFRKSRSQ